MMVSGNNFSKDGKFLSPADDPRVNITFDHGEFGGQRGVLLTMTNTTLNISSQYQCGPLTRYFDRILTMITVKGKAFLFSCMNDVSREQFTMGCNSPFARNPKNVLDLN